MGVLDHANKEKQAALIAAYHEFKRAHGRKPLRDEFLAAAKFPERQLSRLFGSNAYSKLQQMAGDEPNELGLKRTETATIMKQYGGLVEEIGGHPSYLEWDSRGFRPTQSGLNKTHGIAW